MKRTIYDKWLKRGLDFLFSFLLIIFLSPLMIMVALLILIFLGRPILFKQERPGLNEKIFMLYKFRTMRLGKNEIGNDAARLTKFGKFIRSLSLDELPQLFNILKGDMSFIGPRPLLVKYLSLYNQNQRKRHLVRPGLTGLAQVNGRNALDWNEKFDYDIKYAMEMSIIIDFKIVLKTLELWKNSREMSKWILYDF